MIRSSLLTRHYNNDVICEAQTHHYYYCHRDKNKSKSPNVRRYRIITEI